MLSHHSTRRCYLYGAGGTQTGSVPGGFVNEERYVDVYARLQREADMA